MLDMVAFNLNRGSDYVRLFESGDIYGAPDGATSEQARICFAATASALTHDLPQGSLLEKSKTDSALELFRSFKGDVETLMNAFEHRSIAFDRKTSDYYEPGRSARLLLDGAPIAQFGVLHSEVAAKRKLRQDVYLAEIDAEELYKRSLRTIRYQPLPKYPGVERDFSFVFFDTVNFQQIGAAVHSLATPELRSFEP